MTIEFTSMMLSDMRKRVRVVMFIVAAAFIAACDFCISSILRMLINERLILGGPLTHAPIGLNGRPTVGARIAQQAVGQIHGRPGSQSGHPRLRRPGRET